MVFEPLTSLLSPLSKERGEEMPIVVGRRNFTSGITRADLSFPIE
jgi:hypothetical protein